MTIADWQTATMCVAWVAVLALAAWDVAKGQWPRRRPSFNTLPAWNVYGGIVLVAGFLADHEWKRAAIWLAIVVGWVLAWLRAQVRAERLTR